MFPFRASLDISFIVHTCLFDSETVSIVVTSVVYHACDRYVQEKTMTILNS